VSCGLRSFWVASLHEFVGWLLGRIPLDHLTSAHITIDAAAVSDGQTGVAHGVLRPAVPTDKVNAIGECWGIHRGIICALATQRTSARQAPALCTTPRFRRRVGRFQLHLCRGQLHANAADLVDSHVQMFRFFGGVPRLVVPDNLKQGTVQLAHESRSHGRAKSEKEIVTDGDTAMEYGQMGPILLSTGALLQARLGRIFVAGRTLGAVSMNKDEFRKKDSRTAIWIGLIACIVVLGLALFLPNDSMVNHIISSIMRGF
jgi:hypothetical protein